MGKLKIELVSFNTAIKSVITGMFLLLIQWDGFGQHCPYDNAALMALYIHEANDSAVISDLKITLLDKKGNAMLHNEWRKGKWVKDTTYFWQNPKRTTFKGYIDNNHPAKNEQIRFPFAQENYVLVVGDGFPAGNYQVRIEDGKRNRKGGLFKTKTFSLKHHDVWSLCGTYDREVYRTRRQDGRIYQPVDVVLKKRKRVKKRLGLFK